MCMLSERLQILLQPRQRDLLDREARRTGRPIGELVREAIDERFDAERERKLAAVREIEERAPIGVELSPETIERMIASEHDL